MQLIHWQIFDILEDVLMNVIQWAIIAYLGLSPSFNDLWQQKFSSKPICLSTSADMKITAYLETDDTNCDAADIPLLMENPARHRSLQLVWELNDNLHRISCRGYSYNNCFCQTHTSPCHPKINVIFLAK